MSDLTTSDSETTDDEALPSLAQVSLVRLGSFLFVFGAILIFLFFYLVTLQAVEEYLQLRFGQIVSDSIRVPVSSEPPGESIRIRLTDSVENSDWVSFWGVKVDVVVLARDNSTWLYVKGRSRTLRYPDQEPETMREIHAELLPGVATVETSIGHNTLLSNSILTAYATILFTGLFIYNRRVAGLQGVVLDEAREARDRAAINARRIEQEIASVRELLRGVEPAKKEHREEVTRLQSEQQELQARLNVLAARENELRGRAERAAVLEEEGLALEELLEDATGDLEAQTVRIRELETSLKRVRKNAEAGGGKSKETELLTKRLHTLYPNLDIDKRVIDDMIDLQDETNRLRVEESIKRIGEDAYNLNFRRKVGGLPPYLSIYELGFAGKRRIYYTRVKNGRFRILVIGAKNGQRRDLDYLARIPRGEIDS